MTAEDPVRKHLSDAGKKGAASRWKGLSPEQRREATDRATKARGRVADALQRVDTLEAELRAMGERLAAIEQQQIAA